MTSELLRSTLIGKTISTLSAKITQTPANEDELSKVKTMCTDLVDNWKTLHKLEKLKEKT